MDFPEREPFRLAVVALRVVVDLMFVVVEKPAAHNHRLLISRRALKLRRIPTAGSTLRNHFDNDRRELLVLGLFHDRDVDIVVGRATEPAVDRLWTRRLRARRILDDEATELDEIPLRYSSRLRQSEVAKPRPLFSTQRLTLADQVIGELLEFDEVGER